MATTTVGTSFSLVGTLEIILATSIPLRTLPNTTCDPSSHLVAFMVMKNWQLLVLGPARQQRVEGVRVGVLGPARQQRVEGVKAGVLELPRLKKC